MAWIVWTQEEGRGGEMPLSFFADGDCLYRTEELVALIKKIDGE